MIFGGNLEAFYSETVGKLEAIKRRLEVKNLVFKNLMFKNPGFFKQPYEFGSFPGGSREDFSRRIRICGQGT